MPGTAAGSPIAAATARSVWTPSTSSFPLSPNVSNAPAASTGSGFTGTSQPQNSSRGYSQAPAPSMSFSASSMPHTLPASSISVATTAAIAAAAAAQVVPPGVRSVHGLPDPKALTNVGTWHLQPPRVEGSDKPDMPNKWQMAWWRVRFPAPAESGSGSRGRGKASETNEDVERLLQVVTLLNILRYAEACLLELAERIQERQRAQADAGETTASLGHGDEFGEEFLTTRLLWHLSDNEAPSSELLHQRRLAGKSETAARAATAAASQASTSSSRTKRQKLSSIPESAGEPGSPGTPGRSLWLLRPSKIDSAGDSELSFEVCPQAMQLAQKLTQHSSLDDEDDAPAGGGDGKLSESCVAVGDRWHAAQLLSARAQLLGHLPFLGVESHVPHGICTSLQQMRADPLISKAADEALAGSMLAWSLHRQRGRQCAGEQDARSYRPVKARGTRFYLLPTQQQEKDALDLTRRQSPLEVVRVDAFLSSRVMQVFLQPEPPKEGFRVFVPSVRTHGAQEDGTLEAGDAVLLLPLSQKAVFLRTWAAFADADEQEAAESRSSEAAKRLRTAKEQLQQRLLAYGGMNTEQAFQDIELDRFYLLTHEHAAEDGQSFLWPQSLCLRIREMSRSHPAKASGGASSRALDAHSAFTPEALAESLGQTRMTVQRLASSPDTRARKEEADAKLEDPAPDHKDSDAPVETPRIAIAAAAPTASTEPDDDNGDADLWGEDEDDDAEPTQKSTEDNGTLESISQPRDLPSTEPGPSTAPSADPFDQFLSDLNGANADMLQPVDPSAQAPARGSGSYEGVDFVTDDDFDFFGGDAMLREISGGADASTAFDQPSRMYADEGPPDGDGAAEMSLTVPNPLTDPENSMSSSTDGGLSLPDFGPASLSGSSPTPEMHGVVTPATQTEGDAAYRGDMPSPLNARLDDHPEDTSKVDLTFDALEALNAAMIPLPPKAISSKYENGKFSIPVEAAAQTPTATEKHKALKGRRPSASLPSATNRADADPLFKRRRTHLDLFQRRLAAHDDGFSDFATPDASVADRSDDDDTDDADEEGEVEEDEETRIAEQSALLLSAAGKLQDPDSPPPRVTGTHQHQPLPDVGLDVVRHLTSVHSKIDRQHRKPAAADLSAATVISQLRAPGSAFSNEALMRDAELVLLEQPQLLVSNRAAVVKIGPSALPFWDKLQLAPLSGQKNLLCFCLILETSSGQLQEARRKLQEWQHHYQVSRHLFLQLNVN